ncbi:MAG: phosphoribosylanthranilate isomerase [Promethearchaeota archaeon]|nr:MAG: phosphoribosylanthranilate isomerase [Candidatus Lokiarchaeota archaeon]
MDYVKVCGLKETEHIELCSKNEANAVGFIYNVPNSPRNLEKSKLMNLLNDIPKNLLRVVVFKPQNVLELEKITNEIDVDLYQIHNNFEEQELDEISIDLKKKIILALQVNPSNKDDVINKINKYYDQFFGFLIDNSEGHGTEFNFNIVADIIDNTKGASIIVAGGININNIEIIIKNLNPYGIDVSSSLESEKGVKDPLKIENFLKKVNEIKKTL